MAGALALNLTLTPGAVDSKLTKAALCSPHVVTSRHLSLETKREVLSAYHAQCALSSNEQGVPCESIYEFDRLVPLELGGSDKPSNIWPQSLEEARLKDRVEKIMHEQVCHGLITLKGAQRCIAEHWRVCVTPLPTMP